MTRDGARWWTGAALSGALLWAGTSAAAPLTAVLPAGIASETVGFTHDGRGLHDIKDLEVRAWTADDQDLPAVEREIVRHVQQDPSSAMAHYLLSHVMVRNFSRDPSDLYTLKQAADIAQQAIDLEPKKDYGYVALANILDLMGQADRGLALLDEGEHTVPPSWRFYFTRARLTSDAAKVDKVLGLLESALAFVDAQPRIIVPYAVALMQSQASGKQLVDRLERWNARFPSPLFELTAAITYGEMGEPQRAAERYQAILKAHPDNKEAKVNLAILLYRDLKSPAKASALFQDVLEKHAAEMPAPSRAMVYAHAGAALLAEKKYAEADETFTTAVLQDPENLGVIDFATKTYRDAKAHAQLVTLIRRLNDQIQGTGVLHALLGETLSEKLSRHDEALRAFSDAITLDPERSDYYNGMGLTYYRKKSYGEALKLFVTATEVDPNDATARYNEACALALLGRSSEALSTLAEALTLDPRLAPTAKADEDFASLRADVKFMELVQQQPASPAGPEGGIAH